ncbi:uncharacterized protein METZ01_LOCUS510595, partial [marine metagenome]
MNLIPSKLTPIKKFRILWLIPGEEKHPSSMCFVKRQLTVLKERSELQMEVFFMGKTRSPLNLFRRFINLNSVIKDFSPHLIHAQYGTVTSAFGAVSLKWPLVISYRGSDLNPSPGDHWARNLFGKLLSQFSAYRASYIICVSEQLRQKLWRRNIPIEVIPSGVDLELFSPISRNQARRKLEWDQHDPVVLFNAGSNPITKGFGLASDTVKFARHKI